MKDELELINAVKKRIEEVYEIAEKKFEMSLPRPVVTFRVKGRVAGRAYYSRNEIDLNRTLLVQNGDAFISNTPGHEAAHLIARHVFGGNIKPHGAAWQHVMKQIGQAPSRCHTYEVKTPYLYLCKCEKGNYLSTRLHNAVQRGTHKVTCTNCNTKTVWEKLANNTYGNS